MRDAVLGLRQRRVNRCNSLVQVIGSTGRKFFDYKGTISGMEMDPNGRLWWWDSYTRKAIFLHSHRSKWRNFTNGGTMKSLVIDMKNFAMTGKRIPALTMGPWPDWICGGDLWDYGESMAIVRDVAVVLGVLEPRRARAERTNQRGDDDERPDTTD